MKYMNAKKKKLNKIADFVQHEVRIGKCDKQDIDDIISFIRATVLTYDEYIAAKKVEAEEKTMKQLLQEKWAECGLVNDA